MNAIFRPDRDDDLAHARGIIADCCHYPDATVIAACDTILSLDAAGEDAHRAHTLRATLERYTT